MSDNFVALHSPDYFEYLASLVASIPFGCESLNSSVDKLASAIVCPQPSFEKHKNFQKMIMHEISESDFYNAKDYKKTSVENHACDLVKAVFLGILYLDNNVDLTLFYRPDRVIVDYLAGEGVISRKSESSFEFNFDLKLFYSFLKRLVNAPLHDTYRFYDNANAFFVSKELIQNVHADYYKAHPDVVCHPIVDEIIRHFFDLSKDFPLALLASISRCFMDSLYRLIDLSSTFPDDPFIKFRKDVYFIPEYQCARLSNKEFESSMLDFLNNYPRKVTVLNNPLTSYLPDGYKFDAFKDPRLFMRALNHIFRQIYVLSRSWFDYDTKMLNVVLYVDNILTFDTAYITLLSQYLYYLYYGQYVSILSGINLTIVLTPYDSNMINIHQVIQNWTDVIRSFKHCHTFTVLRPAEDDMIHGTIARFDLSKTLDNDDAIYPINKTYLIRCVNAGDPERISDYKLLPVHGLDNVDLFFSDEFMSRLCKTLAEANPPQPAPKDDSSSMMLPVDDWFLDACESIQNDADWAEKFSSYGSMAIKRLQGIQHSVKVSGKDIAEFLTDAKFELGDRYVMGALNSLCNVVVSRDSKIVANNFTFFWYFSYVSFFSSFISFFLTLLSYHFLVGNGPVKFNVALCFESKDLPQPVKSRFISWLSIIAKTNAVQKIILVLDGNPFMTLSPDNLTTSELFNWINAK